MNKVKFSALLVFFFSLSLFNIKTNCQEIGFDNLLKTAVKKPYYTALLVYTTLWATEHLDNYSRKNTTKLGIWIAYLVAQGFSQEDASLIWPLLLMPDKGIFGGTTGVN